MIKLLRPKEGNIAGSVFADQLRSCDVEYHSSGEDRECERESVLNFLLTLEVQINFGIVMQTKVIHFDNIFLFNGYYSSSPFTLRW